MKEGGGFYEDKVVAVDQSLPMNHSRSVIVPFWEAENIDEAISGCLRLAVAFNDTKLNLL